ncbi:MAG: hypothetical protein PHD76_14975 [Methylacidiphilales bacterium]|nr:hypothetical protein [Candidatus Methylacidiphilales bacterium]
MEVLMFLFLLFFAPVLGMVMVIATGWPIILAVLAATLILHVAAQLRWHFSSGHIRPRFRGQR